MSATTKINSGIQTVAPESGAVDQDTLARARKLMAEAVGIDSHIDTIQRVLVMGEDLGQRHGVGHVDIPRLREGEMHAPFFAF